MKKTILTLGLLCTLLNACAYKPIIDTAGRSGTFDSDQAKDITNDTQHCKTIAKATNNFSNNITVWALTQNMDTKYESIIRKCLTKRVTTLLN